MTSHRLGLQHACLLWVVCLFALASKNLGKEQSVADITDKTCCIHKADGLYCCPYTKGSCCGKSYCCPAHTTCVRNGSSSVCANYWLPFSFLRKYESRVPLQPLVERNITVTKQRFNTQEFPTYPNSFHCPYKMTQCSRPYRGYDCCPFEHAVCCGDFLHCCPFGTECDIKLGLCMNSASPTVMGKPWYRRVEALTTALHKNNFVYSQAPVNVRIQSTDIKCQDNVTVCPDRDTCCLTVNELYGCCPLPNAVCCSDGLHCCPGGTQCDIPSATCKLGDNEVPLQSRLMRKLENKGSVVSRPSKIICPGGQFTCPDWATCCDIGGKYACCPLSNAVCCSDKRHCCPKDYFCDLEHAECKMHGLSESTPFVASFRSRKS